MKRQRESTAKTAPPVKAQKVSPDLLMIALQQDATLQNKLDAQDWRKLRALHVQYEKEGLARRSFVDGCSAIVGTYKVCSGSPAPAPTCR